MPLMILARNLKAIREEKRLSQTALANEAGVKQQLISQIEAGKNTSTKFLPQIARALGVSVWDIDPSYAAAPQSDKISGEDEILAVLHRIEGLREHDVSMVLQIIVTALKANASSPAQNGTGDRSAPETPRHESSPSR